MIRPARALLALPLAAALLSACAGGPGSGYSFDPIYAEDVRSVAVPIWDNETFYPGAEVELTEAIVKEIQRVTPWAVVRSDTAETSLEGTIRAIQLETLSIDRDAGLVQEQGLRYTVDFAWKDNRTGQYLVRRTDYDGYAAFVPARADAFGGAPAGRGTGLGGERIQTGQNDVITRLARDIVAELRTAW